MEEIDDREPVIEGELTPEPEAETDTRGEDEAEAEAADTCESEVEKTEDPEDSSKSDQRKNEDSGLIRLYVTGIISGILLVMLVLLLCDIFQWHPFSRTPAADQAHDLTRDIEEYIDAYYWKSDTSDEKFAQMAAKGMVAALQDPYSVYLTPEELKSTRERTQGDYTGIGITLSMDSKTGRAYVTRVESGQPADIGGMKVGDEIIAVDGTSVAGKTLDQISSMIRVEEGQKVVITVLRHDSGAASGSAAASSDGSSERATDGETETPAPGDGKSGEKIDLTVVTKKIVTQSVYHRMLTDIPQSAGSIGYIKITTFNRESAPQFEKAIDELKKQGMKKLIIDVRDNVGGVLTAATSMLNRMLPEGVLITETRKQEQDVIYRSTDEHHLDIPISILINKKSASASEVFAGVMQDRKAATLVGETSYGKGVVQTIFTLPDDAGGIKLTTGEYLLPSGRSIHGKGLTPDVEVAYSGTEQEMGTAKDTQLIKCCQEIGKQ